MHTELARQYGAEMERSWRPRPVDCGEVAERPAERTSTLDRLDAELARQAAGALRWDHRPADERITARVENGWITLEGEVEWQFEREAAECAVRCHTGAGAVLNRICVTAHCLSDDAPEWTTEPVRGWS